MSPGSAGRWALLAALLLWCLQLRYQGIQHDGELYSFQALAHVYPSLLGNDLFLRFGSQDDYSLFARGYALLIRTMGLETAAAWLTFGMQLALLAALWSLARRLLPANLAPLALAATLALPGVYGAAHVFHCFENFVSPRMAAEALALGALGAWLGGARRLAWALWLPAAAFHILMAAAVAVCIAWLWLLQRPKRAAPVVLAVGALLLLASLRTAWRMDDTWLGIIRAGIHYLFLGDWTADDWVVTALPLELLVCAAWVLRGSLAGKVAAAALATGLSGLALTWLGADALHLTRVVQLQPWRWLWLGALVAALLLPILAARLWRAGGAGRVALLLLASCWLLATPLACLLLAPLALAASGWAGTSAAPAIPAPYLRYAQLGAWCVCVVALAWNLACKALLLPMLFGPFTTNPADIAQALCGDGVLPLAIVGAAAACWNRVARPAARGAWRAAWSLAVALALWFNLPGWWQRAYREPLRAALLPWQRLIPAGSEVFIPEQPLLGWALLLRPGYYSPQQAVSEVFSRPAALEIRARARAASAFLTSHGLQPWRDLRVPESTGPRLAALCAATGVRFVVTADDLQAQPVARLPPGLGTRLASLRLYDCTRT